MKRGLATFIALLLIAGCASVDTVRDAKGQGAKRTFRQPYDVVYQAAVNAAVKRNLEFVEQDRAAGRILLSSGPSWTSFGERIAVFVSRAGGRTTTVEIVSKPLVPAVTFPPDWPVLLFGEIEEALAAARTPR